jgi:hypothetical protein
VPAEAVKEEPASSSYNPAAEPVSRWQYEEGYWEMRNRFLEQSKRLDQIESFLGRHPEFEPYIPLI